MSGVVGAITDSHFHTEVAQRVWRIVSYRTGYLPQSKRPAKIDIVQVKLGGGDTRVRLLLATFIRLDQGKDQQA